MNPKQYLSFLLLIGILFLETNISNAQVVYVTQSGAGTFDGSSWANAKNGTALREVIATLPDSGEVWIAEGIYYPHPTSRDSSFVIYQNRKMYGGFNGTELSIDDRDWEAYPTILSGDIGTSGINTDNSYSVLQVVSTTNNIVDTQKHAIIDGFTITKGNNSRAGGGILIRNGINRPKFYNCIVKDNYADKGAAIYDSMNYANRPYFYNCNFYNNTASTGAVYSRSRQSYYGGATFEKCNFSNNSVLGAGVIFNITCRYFNNDVYRFKDCIFKEHDLAQGVLFQIYGAKELILDGSRFTQNKTHNQLLYIYNTSLTMNNCVIDSNEVTGPSPNLMIELFVVAKANIELQATTYDTMHAINRITNSQFINNITPSRFFYVSTGTGSSTLGITNSDSTEFTNCLFYNCGKNSTLDVETRGGGRSDVFITNCTFYDDATFAQFKGWDRQVKQFVTKSTHPNFPTPGSARMYINNSIFHYPGIGNRSIRTEYSLYGAFTGEKILNVRNTALQSMSNWPDLGGTDMGGNMINVNPQFIDITGDFRLKCTSPLINAGLNSLYGPFLPSVDLDSNIRINGVTIDMGAYEYTSTPIQIFTDTNINDLNLNINIASNYPIDSLSWTLGDGNSGNTNPISHTYSISGTYNICITIYANCETKDTCFNLTMANEGVNIHNTDQESAIRIYPNPAYDFITIDGITVGTGIRLINILGQELHSSKAQHQQEKISLSGLPCGTYFLRLQTSDGSQSSAKFIKE